MAKFSLALAATLAASAAAFAPTTVTPVSTSTTALSAWDPLSLYTLEDSADTFPNMFPKGQFLDEAEIKHGRMAMLGWTGVWATHVGGFGLGLHFPGFPVESDWTKALGVFAADQPAWFGAILLFISIAEGESVGHSGDNWRNMSTKEPGNLGFDPYGLKQRLSPERQAHFKDIEMKNGRAAMIAMASLFSYEALPGSVPIMDIIS